MAARLATLLASRLELPAAPDNMGSTHLKHLKQTHTAQFRHEKSYTELYMHNVASAGRAEFYLKDVAARLSTLLASRLEPPAAAGDVITAAVRLGAQRLLLTDAGARRMRMRVALNVAPADAAHAMKGEAAIAAIPWLAQLELV